MNVPGIVSIATFYLLILAVGIWAGWKQRGKGSQGGTESIMLAGRDMGTFVGILTMTGAVLKYLYEYKMFDFNSGSILQNSYLGWRRICYWIG